MTLPSGKAISYTYLTRNGIYDNPSSRVTEVKDDTVVLALYDYAGVGQVVGTDYTEADVYQKLFEVTTYGDLDRFNRTVKSRWTKELGTNVDFYHVELTYDRNSNITSADDTVHTGFDVMYSMDSTNRLVRAEEGTLSAGSIGSRTRDQQWTLNHTGNWNRDKVDLNGDGDFVDSSELDDTRTHNVVNELTARDTDSNSSNNYTLTFDAAGNQTDDGKDYEYVWDAFYRLRKVNRTDNQALVAECRYNGLGYRIAVHADTDTDGDVDSNDKWYYDAFDERWRQVARFRESDTSPKEEFVAHAAGADGASSYIDQVTCRYKDANTAWTSASDGTLEERLYYCQNRHADVIAIVASDGMQREGDRYSAYGIPFGLPGGDANSDGDCDSGDLSQVQAWIDVPAYDLRGDIDLDGDVDSTDKSEIQSSMAGIVLGRNMLSSPNTENYKSYAGAMTSRRLSSLYHLRHREGMLEVGRWATRDPLLYDPLRTYESLASNPIVALDPWGLFNIRLHKKTVTDCPSPSISCEYQFMPLNSEFGSTPSPLNPPVSQPGGWTATGIAGFVTQTLNVYTHDCPCGSGLTPIDEPPYGGGAGACTYNSFLFYEIIPVLWGTGSGGTGVYSTDTMRCANINHAKGSCAAKATGGKFYGANHSAFGMLLNHYRKGTGYRPMGHFQGTYSSGGATAHTGTALPSSAPPPGSQGFGTPSATVPDRSAEIGWNCCPPPHPPAPNQGGTCTPDH